MDQKAGEMQTETSSMGKGPTQKRAATQRRIEAFQTARLPALLQGEKRHAGLRF